MIVRYTRAFRRYEYIYLVLEGHFEYHSIASEEDLQFQFVAQTLFLSVTNTQIRLAG